MKSWLIRIGAGVATLAVVAFGVGYLARPASQNATTGFHAARATIPQGMGISTGGGSVPGSMGTGSVLSTNVSGAMDAGVSAPDSFSARPGSTASLPSAGDRIARTADLTVEVRKGHFDDTWVAAFRIASKFGGQVMNASRGDNGTQPVPLPQQDAAKASKRPAFGDITMRIPSARFEAATNELRAIGIVRGDATSAEDVSQEYVDLQSRLRNMRAEERVLLALFARAKTVGETIAVETKLADVQGQIEETTGRIKYLDSRTSFAFVTLHLSEPGAVFAASDDEPTFAQAWDTAVRGLVRIGSAALIGAIWCAPFALLALGGFALRRRRTAQTAA